MEGFLHDPDINIYAVLGIVQDWTMKMKISRDHVEDCTKPSEIAEEAMGQAFGNLECIKRAPAVARIQRQRAPTTASAEQRSQRRHNLASTQVDVSEAAAACVEKQVEAAEADYLAACAEYDDEWTKLKSRYRMQAAAFVAAEVARRRLVLRELRKTALTAATDVTEQKQQHQQQRRALAIAAASAAGQRQQIDQQLVEVDTPAESATRQSKKGANMVPVEDTGNKTLIKKRMKSECNYHE